MNDPADQVRAKTLEAFAKTIDIDQGANYEAGYTLAGVVDALEVRAAEYRKAAGWPSY